MKLQYIMQNACRALPEEKIVRTIVREVDTCAVAFDGLRFFVDSTVVEVGSSPITSTAAWTLAMLTTVVRCPDPTTELARMYKVMILAVWVSFSRTNDVSDSNTTWYGSGQVL